jgi:hypothetical protein
MKMKISGNRKIGYRLIVPIEAYNNAGQPKEYDCVAFRDGTLVYQPVLS